MILPIIFLLSLGIVVIYTSSTQLALAQLIFALVGIAGYFLLRNFDFRIFLSLHKYLYILTLILLVVVFILGVETRGSVRWISLGSFNLQPSELAKISLILTLAAFWKNNIPSWKNISKSGLILLPFAFLVFQQPDLGTTLTLLFIWIGMLIASSISLIKFSLISLSALLLTPVVWFFMRDYQKQRLLSFLFPNKDPLGEGYNVLQSTIAIGSGQLFGRGLGRGTQSRLQFLPEFRTDFIFAFIAEELGFIGSLLVLVLYLLIFYFLIRNLSRVSDRFGELIIVGVMSMLLFQILINIGMNIGILPITGITLPLLSYGGSSLIITLLSLGFVSSVAKFGLKRKEASSVSLSGI